MAAEYDPEAGPSAWAQDAEYGLERDNQESSYQSSDHQQEADLPRAQDPHSSGDMPSHDGATEDAGDYDPESVTPLTAATPQIAERPAAPNPSSQPITRQPRSAGGFLVGESDSEDDASTPASNGPVVQSRPPQQSFHGSDSARDGRAAAAPNLSPVSQVTTVVPSVSDALHVPSTGGAGSAVAAARTRLPNDTVGILEDKIRGDPRGAMDAWLALMAEHRKRNRTSEVRKVYERFLAVFPHAAEIWVAWLEMELDMSNFNEAENIFRNCLVKVPTVQLFTVYLDYVRRRNDLSDSSGVARQTVTRAYEFVLENVGFDKDAGKIWADYILFIKHAPGQVGGSGWQDQQKMDLLRKAYQRAICMPISNVNTLWKEYDQFEMGLNKTTGRKFLAERSPTYMSAKSANTALENITRGLQRTSLPRLPPAPGFEGDQDYAEQVELWKKWIEWEKTDPLDIKTDEPDLFQKRILHVYRQALMALRFWPEMWVDAAEWCFETNIVKDGTELGLDFLLQGVSATPESVLLALKHAERIESTFPVEENDEAKAARGVAVRAPYNKVLDTLYDMIKGLKEREKQDVARVEEAAALQVDKTVTQRRHEAEDDDEEDGEDNDSTVGKARETAKQEQIRAIQQGFAAQTQLLSRTISFVWIALTRAMRRVQGKGKPGTPLGGMRQVFTEARQRGRLTSDVYVAVAQLEWSVYKDPAGVKIFERGSKLFPEDEYFTIEYLKFLHSRDDNINARVVFETCVNRLAQKPELVHKAKPLYLYFHKYESQFGDLSHMLKYEKRMAELFPGDPKLASFSARYSTDKFDPITARIIVSPATQLRPKLGVMPSVEQPVSTQNSPRPPLRAQNSPRPQFLPATNSPKRPFPLDDFDDVNPPRKVLRGADHREFQRGESPLKGAAGRRLDQQRRAQGQSSASHGSGSGGGGPAPIARDITFLLSQIPPAHAYNSHRFNSPAMVRLLRDTAIPDYPSWNRSREGGGSAAVGASRHAAGSDSRQVSGEYGFRARDSPAPGAGGGRPQSPYDGRSRPVPAAVTYQQAGSNLRPGSSGSYEPPPPSLFRPDGSGGGGLPPNPYGQPQSAVAVPQPDASGTWPPYGAPAPAPVGYQQGPPPGQQGYGGYRY